MRRLDLRERVVVITGAADGIGLATARVARSRGALLALLDIDGDRAVARAAELGAGSIGLQADVTKLAQLEAAFAEVDRRLGRCDVVVANAGVGPRSMTVERGDRAHQRHVLDVNLHGVWHTAWVGAPRIAEREGHLLVISSIAAFVLTPSWAAYAAAKAGVEALARSMRVELAASGATVGVAHFGLVATRLVAEFEQDPVAQRLERLYGGRLMRRVTPQSSAEAVIAGIERRVPRTIHPARWRAFYALRGIAGPLMDAVVTRDPRVRRLMTDLRERDIAAGRAGAS
jgi:NAD(P)-dependent dehydrogenase (short-subunit alcohol dehydrogenase family)